MEFLHGLIVITWIIFWTLVFAWFVGWVLNKTKPNDEGE